MTPDLHLLLWVIVLTVVQVVVATSGASLQVGLPRFAGNREGLPEITGWAGRAQRAHRNMLENLPIFVALVLVAQVAGRTNATTLLGAELFVWARLAYAIIYIIGIPWLRTAAWLVSVIGMVMIFLQVF